MAAKTPPFMIKIEGHPNFEIIEWAMKLVDPKIRVKSIDEYSITDPKLLDKLHSYNGYVGVVYSGKKPTAKEVIEMLKTVKNMRTAYMG